MGQKYRKREKIAKINRIGRINDFSFSIPMTEKSPSIQIAIIKEPGRGEPLKKAVELWAKENDLKIKIKIADNRAKIFEILNIVQKKFLGIFNQTSFKKTSGSADIIIAGSQIRGMDLVKIYPILKKVLGEPLIITVSQDDQAVQSLYNDLGTYRIIKGSELDIAKHVQKAFEMIESRKQNPSNEISS